MRVLLVNPNTSHDMTARMVAQARSHCGPRAEVTGVTARFGCAVIASRASYAIAAHAALDACAGYAGTVDGVILACFGDPGLAALRELMPCPVVALAQCAAEAAAARGPYAIVTAGLAWVPMLDELMHAGPHAALYRGTCAVDTTGLAIARKPQQFIEALDGAVARACSSGASSVILGGGALAGFGSRLKTPVTLIDPLEAAVAAIERLITRAPGASSVPAGSARSAASAHAADPAHPLERPAHVPLASQGLSAPLEALLART
jgi:Asp/Glu/hydantoin racemase